MPSLPPANPSFSFLYCPHPHPLPGGKGENQVYFMQGAPPLASPRLSRRQHGLNLRYRCPTGGLPSLPPARPAFSLLYCPHPPTPLPLRGRGRLKVFCAGGYRPRHPCIKPFAALTASAMRAPRARSLRFAAKTIGSDSLLAVPAAKERGDRGRWNYPSHATAAFEMVLSPGAGIASAARVQPRGCKGRSPLHKKTIISPPSRREGGRGDGGKQGKRRQGWQARKKDMPSAGYLLRGVSPCRFRLRCGDARGEAPCIRKL